MPEPEIICPQCSTQIAPTLLSCPRCQRLVHTEKLNHLAREAERLTQQRDLSGALTTWRDALELLPPGSRQHQIVLAWIKNLSGQVDQETAPASTSRTPALRQASTQKKTGMQAAGLGAIGLLLWKFKFAVIFVLTKLKFLLLGLTKASTLFSMLLSFGVYWAAWGWTFALGLVLSIYVHEMGHVFALRRLGIRATAPMFIPGFGAMVRLKQYPADPHEDARIGLAGPLWGLGAAVAAFAVFLISGGLYWAAIARVGAWINLFNLLPVWQLDGGRGFRALSRAQRWLVVASLAVMFVLTNEGLLLLLLLAAGFRALQKTDAPASDRLALLQFIFLGVTLSLLCTIHVPIESAP